jgi:hypothetical protein
MKRLILPVLMGAALVGTIPNLNAQVTSSGGFTVSGSIDPSISLTFASDASGLALSSGSGTNTATMALGHVAAYGYTPPTGVTQAVNAAGASATYFTISTPFDVLVMEANSTSAAYTLTAALNSADTTNTWKVGGVTVASGTPATITSTGTYNSAQSFTLLLQIPFTNTSGTISNVVNFVATAN